jgi:hypothetical protein
MTTDFPESSHWENDTPGMTPNPSAHVTDQRELRGILDSLRLEPAPRASPASS